MSSQDSVIGDVIESVEGDSDNDIIVVAETEAPDTPSKHTRSKTKDKGKNKAGDESEVDPGGPSTNKRQSIDSAVSIFGGESYQKLLKAPLTTETAQWPHPDINNPAAVAKALLIRTDLIMNKLDNLEKMQALGNMRQGSVAGSRRSMSVSAPAEGDEGLGYELLPKKRTTAKAQLKNVTTLVEDHWATFLKAQFEKYLSKDSKNNTPSTTRTTKAKENAPKFWKRIEKLLENHNDQALGNANNEEQVEEELLHPFSNASEKISQASDGILDFYIACSKLHNTANPLKPANKKNPTAKKKTTTTAKAGDKRSLEDDEEEEEEEDEPTGGQPSKTKKNPPRAAKKAKVVTPAEEAEQVDEE